MKSLCTGTSDSQDEQKSNLLLLLYRQLNWPALAVLCSPEVIQSN